MSVVCWCGSLGYLKLPARRVFVPRECCSEGVSRALRSIDADVGDPGSHANAIHGIVRIELQSGYSFMSLYEAAQRMQVA